MRIIVRPLMILTLAMFLVVPLTAQHSFIAVYDSSQPISVTGTIVNVDSVTPNVFIHAEWKTKLRVESRSGHSETAPPQGLMNGLGLDQGYGQRRAINLDRGFPLQAGRWIWPAW